MPSGTTSRIPEVNTKRPVCKCHGEPMLRNGTKENGSQKWRCRTEVKAYNDRNNPRQVRGASGYLGMAPTIEQANLLTGLGREFRDRQHERRA